MEAYSKDLRERVAAAWDAGQTRNQIAERFAVSVSWIGKLIQRRRERGSLAAKTPSGGRGRLKLALAGLGRLKAVAEARPDATLAELCDGLACAGGPSVSDTTLSRALGPGGLDLPLKKSRRGRRNKTGRT
jgi:transposase